jgi:hypothetical protein
MVDSCSRVARQRSPVGNAPDDEAFILRARQEIAQKLQNSIDTSLTLPQYLEL